MEIISLKFIFFLAILVILYFCVPRRVQWITILLANLFFYAYAGIKYIVYILLISGITYGTAIQLEKLVQGGTELIAVAETTEEKKAIKTGIIKKKKLFCGIAILAAMGIWAVLKYGNFFIDNCNALINSLCPGKMLKHFSWIIPLGMSFYTFDAVGYLVDIYRGKYKAERNYVKYLTFISYFPHIVQGPFSRFDHLGKNIFEEHAFSYDRMCEGCARILWGVFKKVVVADQIGVAVNAIFEGYRTYTGIYMMFAMCAYGIQLYADFSGYMDIMCGFSRILGIELAENFKRPYFAKTVDEFWRRWHITLGTWFKDYVFYPVSMGKIGQKLGKSARKRWGAKMGKLVPGYFALIFVWTATGLWHGANWTYLIWGYLNLLVIVSTMQMTDFYNKAKEKMHIKSDGLPWTVFCIIRTYLLVCFFRFFSAAPDIHTAMEMLKATVGEMHFEVIKVPSMLFVNVGYIEMFFIVIGSCSIFFVDLLEEIGVWHKLKTGCPMLVRNIVYTLMILLIAMNTFSETNMFGGFMYANF